MGLLDGKVALITGGSRGIGKAVALKFAEQGADVAFTGTKLYEEVERELESFGIKARSYASNVSDFDQSHELVNQVVKDFGKIDILVNNAGIVRDDLMLRMSEEKFDEVIDVNLKSTFNFCHAVTPFMMRARCGSIINMTSVVGTNGNAGQSNYAASKAGMIGIAKSLAKELGPRGIRVNCIAPGFILTDMTKELPEDIKQSIIKDIPLRRGGTPEEVANTALFLASDLSSYISGQVILVSGAMIG